MTHGALCAALRKRIAGMPGRVCRLTVTPAQFAVLTGPPDAWGKRTTPRFCGIPICPSAERTGALQGMGSL